VAKTFAYIGKNLNGQIMTGTILADSEHAVAIYIREQGYFITQIKEDGNSHLYHIMIEKLKPIGVKELAIICRLFSTMVDAGIPLVSCLNVLIEQTDNPQIKRSLQDVYQKVKAGESLSKALSNHPQVFPDLMINMVEAGEIGGMLDHVLNRLANHFEKEYKMREKIKSAMTYPLIIISISILVVIFILVFVLPTFVQLFSNMNKELPYLTLLLLAISHFILAYFPFIIAAIIGGSYGLKVAYRKEKNRRMMDNILLRLPFVGIGFKKFYIARFCRISSTLLRGGVSIIIVLEIVQKIISNHSMVDAISQARSGIQQGLGLATTLAPSRVLTPMTIQMLAIGEESGTLDLMLEKIADFYESDVDDMLTRLSTIIEPIVIGILSVFIGLIITSIMIPLFELITTAGSI